jgi:hypothetical protein
MAAAFIKTVQSMIHVLAQLQSAARSSWQRCICSSALLDTKFKQIAALSALL